MNEAAAPAVAAPAVAALAVAVAAGAAAADSKPATLAAGRQLPPQPAKALELTDDEEADRIFRYWLSRRTSVNVSLNYTTGKDGKRKSVFHLRPVEGAELPPRPHAGRAAGAPPTALMEAIEEAEPAYDNDAAAAAVAAAATHQCRAALADGGQPQHSPVALRAAGVGGGGGVLVVTVSA